MAVAELQAPSKSGCTLGDRCGACAARLSAAEKARIPKKLAVFQRRLDDKVSTPYYAVSEALFRVVHSVELAAPVPLSCIVGSVSETTETYPEPTAVLPFDGLFHAPTAVGVHD